jgi:penicillin-binding protein 1B
VRGRGFTAPAAGKTGTSHDGWFAGFTSDLLCIVWVGFDDYRELDVEGAHSALPIWTEFMKRALTHRRYADAKTFNPPDGVVTVTIDPESGMPATAQCPTQASEVFIAGTEPVGTCPLHGGKGDRTTVSGWDTPSIGSNGDAQGRDQGKGQPGQVLTAIIPRRDNMNARPGGKPAGGQPDETSEQNPPEEKAKKKGFFGRLKDVFR